MKQSDVFKWGLTIAGLYAVYRVLQKVGVIQTAQQQVVQTVDVQDYTSPRYWSSNQQAGKNVKVLTMASVNKLVADLLDSHGVFNDDEEKMTGVFKQLKFKSQYSFLADYFTRKTGQDLTAWLKNYFSDSELSVPFNWVNSLPSGIS